MQREIFQLLDFVLHLFTVTKRYFCELRQARSPANNEFLFARVIRVRGGLLHSPPQNAALEKGHTLLFCTLWKYDHEVIPTKIADALITIASCNAA